MQKFIPYFLFVAFSLIAQFSVLAQESTASYKVIFDATWSGVTHPVDYPSDARWSPAVGLTHNQSASLFEPGQVATQGIVNMSQTGSRDPLNDEIDAMIATGGGEYRVNATTRVNPSPDTVSFTFNISSSHPYLSLTSMIAPSPDWFVGFRNLNLFENGEWTESRIVQFSPYDSGSDSGTTFASPNQDTQPREGITAITDGPLVVDGMIASMGVWRIERIDAASDCEVSGGELVGGPFEFCVDGTADNIPSDALSVNGATGANSQWVVTDDRGYILGLPPSFSAPDFDEAGVGVCFVYHLSYEDGLTGLEAGNNIANFDGCFNLSNGVYVNRKECAPIVGGVYAMTNGEGQVAGNVQGPNSIVAYGQAADGTLRLLGTYPTGGNGGDYDGGEGLDPLISAYAITKTVDNRFVLAVNAGSNTVTSLRVNEDFSLAVVDTESTLDVGPNSIAHKPSTMPGVNGLVYVSNITRSEFLSQGEPAQQGSIIGYRLMDDGSLEPVVNSVRALENRPSAVQFSPNGEFLVVASINAGSSALASDNQDEIVVYRVNADGTLSASPTAGATSTLRDNAAGRNLPSAIGFQIVGDNYVVVTEAREFQANGAPPAFPALQDGSVSTWQIQADGSLTPINLDVASGVNNTGRTACWLDFSDEETFFVSNAIEAGLAAYSFDNGNIELLNQVAAQGTGATGNTTDPAAAFGTTEGWIDLWISDDGKYLYQCYGLTGTVGVFEINGSELTLVQEISGDLPTNNVQGIVAVGSPLFTDVADLAIDITVDNVLYNIHEEVEYTITVSNKGTEDASDIVVSASLPQGMVFTSAEESKGEYDLFFEEWTINSLARGETATLKLTLFTLTEGVDIVNTVEIISSDIADENGENNVASVTIEPFTNGGVAGGEGSIDLELAIDVDSPTFTQFEDVTYTITITNNGVDAATSIFVSAGLPEDLVYVSNSESKGDYNLFFERWEIQELAAGESATLTLTLFPLVDNGSVTNFVEVFVADQTDVDSTPANGTGSPVEDDEAAVTIAAQSGVQGRQASSNIITNVIFENVYPNPAVNLINIALRSEVNYDTQVRILDVTGKQLISNTMHIEKGYNEMRVDVSSLVTGVYFISMQDGENKPMNYRFVKTGE